MDSSLRDASTEAEKTIGNLGTELSLRKDVFENVKAFAQTEQAGNLNYEEKNVGSIKCTEYDTHESMKRAVVSINFYTSVLDKIASFGGTLDRLTPPWTNHYFEFLSPLVKNCFLNLLSCVPLIACLCSTMGRFELFCYEIGLRASIESA